ncbi:MAG: DotA/TraY family protein, partial [Gammaproteobacteria bacterium]|nr:DotA/TraY family protein [Gammaproteobacteria bacterium]
TGIMVIVGIISAYFIPFLPYMMFTFGSIGWLIAVIEAMVAAPIVALGITHPEGEGPFGKGEQAIMILMNVFLRPALMIIGYIAGIMLSYVAVWVINAGFSNVLQYMQGDGQYTADLTPNYNASTGGTWTSSAGGMSQSGSTSNDPGYLSGIQVGTGTKPVATDQMPTSSSGYTGWAGIFSYFFSVLMYTSLYLIVVQKAFTLIAILPDKVLRWIGGQPESYGQDAGQWGEEAKGQIKEAGSATHKASGQVAQAGMSKMSEQASKLKDSASHKIDFEGSGPDSSPGN